VNISQNYGSGPAYLIVLGRRQKLCLHLQGKLKEFKGDSVGVLDLVREGCVLPKSLDDAVVCTLHQLAVLFVLEKDLDGFPGSSFGQMDVGSFLVPPNLGQDGSQTLVEKHIVLEILQLLLCVVEQRLSLPIRRVSIAPRQRPDGTHA